MNTLRRISMVGGALAALLVLGCGGDDGGGGSVDAAQGGAPTASFTFTPGCTETSSTEVEFTSTSTDPESQTLTCDWVFDGCTLNSCNRSGCTQTGVTFFNQAPYQVTLTVTDTDGNTSTDTQTISPC